MLIYFKIHLFEFEDTDYPHDEKKLVTYIQ